MALHRPPLRVARHMRLYSSRIFRNFNLLPSFVWSNWKSIAHTWCGYSALSTSLEPLLAPDPLHPLVVDAPTLDSQAPANQSPTPAHVTPGQLPYPLPELVLLNVRHRRWPALGGAILADQTAGTALGSPKSILQNHDSSVAPRGALCSATTFRAQKFPVAPQGAPHGATSSYGFAGSAARAWPCRALPQQVKATPSEKPSATTECSPAPAPTASQKPCGWRRLASVAYGLRPTSTTCRRRDAANGGTWQRIPPGLGIHRQRFVLG